MNKMNAIGIAKFGAIGSTFVQPPGIVGEG
jgi:hypothetical protein